MGSYAGLVVATVASLIISIYLYYKPPTLPNTPSKLSLEDITREDINNSVINLKRKVDNARKSF